MTLWHQCVPSSFDKNASSLQHTDGFSIGSAEHRSHKRSKDVFDGNQQFLTLKLNLPSSSSSCYDAFSGRSSLGEYSRLR